MRELKNNGKPIDQISAFRYFTDMDWQTLIRDLTDRAAGGFTQVELAQKCECAQATISDLARGVTTTPRADLGLKLIALHCDLVGRRSATRKPSTKLSKSTSRQNRGTHGNSVEAADVGVTSTDINLTTVTNLTDRIYGYRHYKCRHAHT